MAAAGGLELGSQIATQSLLLTLELVDGSLA
jgi:hypothetical protein